MDPARKGCDMTIVTTEVTYDRLGMANRIKRRNDKDRLAWALAEIWELAKPDSTSESPLDDIETIVRRVI